MTGRPRIRAASAAVAAGATLALFLAGCLAPAAVPQEVGLSNLVVVDPPAPAPGLDEPVRLAFEGRIVHMCAAVCSVPGSWSMVSLAWDFDVPEGTRHLNATLAWSTGPVRAPGEMGYWIWPFRDGKWQEGTGAEAWGDATPVHLDLLLTAQDHGPYRVEVMNWNVAPADVVVEVVLS